MPKADGGEPEIHPPNLLTITPEDEPLQLLLQKAQTYAENGVPEDRDGIKEMRVI